MDSALESLPDSDEPIDVFAHQMALTLEISGLRGFGKPQDDVAYRYRTRRENDALAHIDVLVKGTHWRRPCDHLREDLARSGCDVQILDDGFSVATADFPGARVEWHFSRDTETDQT